MVGVKLTTMDLVKKGKEFSKLCGVVSVMRRHRPV